MSMNKTIDNVNQNSYFYSYLSLFTQQYQTCAINIKSLFNQLSSMAQSNSTYSTILLCNGQVFFRTVLLFNFMRSNLLCNYQDLVKAIYVHFYFIEFCMLNFH